MLLIWQSTVIPAQPNSIDHAVPQACHRLHPWGCWSFGLGMSGSQVLYAPFCHKSGTPRSFSNRPSFGYLGNWVPYHVVSIYSHRGLMIETYQVPLVRSDWPSVAWDHAAHPSIQALLIQDGLHVPSLDRGLLGAPLRHIVALNYSAPSKIYEVLCWGPMHKARVLFIDLGTWHSMPWPINFWFGPDCRSGPSVC